MDPITEYINAIPYNKRIARKNDRRSKWGIASD